MPVTHTAEEAYEMVLDYAGASLKRDAADARIVAGIKDGTNRLIDSQSEVGGFPTLNSLPAPADTDRDGMPDTWETDNGLDPADPEDRNDDRNHDGFTNLDEYLYSLVPLHTNAKPVVSFVSPVTDTGYLQDDTVFVKVMAFDYGEGSIESLDLHLGEDMIVSSDSGAIDTILTGLSTDIHYLIAKATDDSGNVAYDTSKIYIGSKLCTLTIDSIYWRWHSFA